MDKTLRSRLYNNKVFKIAKSDYDKYSKTTINEVTELPDRMTVGLLTLPFKFRPQKETAFDTEFNINTTLNVRLFSVFNNTSAYVQIGAGIGSTNLNSKNASGIGDKPQDVSLLSLHTGFMVQYKRVQAGLYLGVDHINNQTDYQWKHQGKPWFGFGVGYEIFKIDLGEKKQKENKN